MSNSWSEISEQRRVQIESGTDITFNRVFIPYYRQFVEAANYQSLLEVGSGTGHLARELSAYVRIFHAVEPSEGMFKVATDVLRSTRVHLYNEQVEHYSSTIRFECIISHLCVQAVSDMDAFIDACIRLLTKDGVFIFSIPHPCFWNDYQHYFDLSSFDYITERFTSATLTISKDREGKMAGIPYYHRPLQKYIAAIANTGARIRKFDEIFPAVEVQFLYPNPWGRPRYCVFHIEC